MRIDVLNVQCTMSQGCHRLIKQLDEKITELEEEHAAELDALVKEKWQSVISDREYKKQRKVLHRGFSRRREELLKIRIDLAQPAEEADPGA